MTTTTCDLCQAVIPKYKYDIAKLPRIRFELGKDAAGASRNCVAEYEGDGPRFVCQFNTTDLAFCEQCVLKAFKKAVAELEVPVDPRDL